MERRQKAQGENEVTEALVTAIDEGPARRLTLNSPANRNALSQPLLHRLKEELERAGGTPAVRVIVLAHTGPVFCAGADMKEQLAESANTGKSSGAGALVPILELIQRIPQPVVAEVRGPVRGGGMGLVAAADIALASGTANFAFSEIKVGVAPAVIAVPVLARVNRTAALDLFLTGRTIDAAEAWRVGLVTRVVPTGAEAAETARAVEELVAGAPGAQREIKRLVREVPLLDQRAAYERMVELSRQLFSGVEGQEGMRAFREHRAPIWPNDRA